MYFIIYKITNLINGKYYFGKHQTKELDDGYMGSGKLIVRAIKKYGLESFKKEILHIFDNEADMNNKEAEVVVINENTYNLCPGGRGGFGYINSNEKLRIKKNKKAMKISMKNGIREKALSGLKEKYKNKEWVAEIKKREIQTKRDNGFDFRTRLGMQHSTKTIEKMKESHKGKHSGSKNSQYGKHWITNGTENKLTKDNNIPVGWYNGRIMKK